MPDCVMSLQQVQFGHTMQRPFAAGSCICRYVHSEKVHRFNFVQYRIFKSTLLEAQLLHAV